MLEVLNHTFTTAPLWTNAAANVGMVGVPMCAMFDYAMGTPSGFAAFLDPEVNAHLKKILNEWGKFLKSPESAEVLGGHAHGQGWFGDVGRKDLMEVANASYQTNNSFAHYNDSDPLASPDDDNVIANACESKTFAVARNVKLRDHFWVGTPAAKFRMLQKLTMSRSKGSLTA